MVNSSTFNIAVEKSQKQKDRISIEDTRDMITMIEDNLRDMVDSVLTRSYGAAWEDNPQIGWSKSKKQSLEKRLENKKLKFPEQIHSTRLLDHGYVFDLRYLIDKHNDSFKSELADVKKVKTYLEILAENRNSMMHTDDVDEYQKHLCLGICGYLLQIVERWRLGYNRRATSWEANIMFLHSESIGEDTAKNKAQKLADEAVQRLKDKATGSITEDPEDNYRVYKIPINKDKLMVHVYKPTKRNYSKHGIFQSVDIRLCFESEQLISAVLDELPPNWTFTWIIPEGLDAIFTMEKIEQIRRIRTSGSKIYIENELVGRGMEFILQNSVDRTIRADIGGGKGHPTRITLVFDGSPGGGFTNAHKFFSPDEILAICYGERTPIEVLKLIDRACK